MSIRARGVGRRLSWFLALALVATPCQLFAQDAPMAQAAPAPSGTRSLVPRYVSFGVLQALDVHSTMRALNNGAVEANPLMKGVAHQPAAFMAVKAGAGATTIWLSHRLAKKNKVAAMLLMAGVNSAYAMVVAHNYRTGR